MTAVRPLVEAQGFLAVEMDVQQLAGIEGLGKFVVRVQAGHLDVGRLRVDAAHLRMVYGRDEREYAAHRRQVEIAAISLVSRLSAWIPM